ncbi:hypothetical protein Cgig2_006396 [Carnegiea gigantea]|uniref:Uncharacterized protein n=1 Tax=Carnegiea gigantea TaxID=171969 RepID=A0A9Q1QCP7_9CARY|nr:hypothetical protein Cgig2_006396 [Carnegiea gigantea]
MEVQSENYIHISTVPNPVSKAIPLGKQPPSNRKSTVKKTRGIVYCRKLTMLPLGEKLIVEFDNDGIPVGANGSNFSFFLGNQVRNRIVIPVQKEKYGRECSRLNLMLKSRTRTSDEPVNAKNLANNMHAKVSLNDKTNEQIFQEVLGKDTHGCLSAYGRGKSITDYFAVKPSRLDLTQDVIELKKRADETVMEAKKDVEEARKEAEHAKLEAEQAKKEAEEARKEAETTR